MITPEDVIALNGQMIAALETTDLVRIDEDALGRFAQELTDTSPTTGTTPPAILLGQAAQRGWQKLSGVDASPPMDPEAIFRAILVLSAINYCFWPAEGDQRWTYKGKHGFAGLLALVCDLLEQGFRADLPERLIAALRADDRMRGLQLRDERVGHIKEVRALLQRLHGSRRGDGFVLCEQKKALGHSAPRFVAWLANECPGFVDYAELNGDRVPMFKRAWLLTMLHDAASQHPDLRWDEDLAPGINNELAFTGLESALAIDYRLPQALAQSGVLIYRADLAKTVQAQDPLNDPQAEAALRIASALAFRRILAYRPDITPAALDRTLWRQARSCILPHHRYLTTAY